MMQRKNAKPPASSASSSSNPPYAPLSISPSPSTSNSLPVATVVRKTFGTSPFDKYWLNTDCCGLFCALLTYSLHIFAAYAVTNILLPPWMSYFDDDGIRHMTWGRLIHSILFCTTAALAMIAHFQAMTTDPGAVPPDAEPIPDPLDVVLHANGTPQHTREERNKTTRRPKRLCRRCNSYKPDRAHHCSICKRCVVKMDHHCPWVNNCVGIANHKFFLLFIFYTALSCGYTLALLGTRFLYCVGGYMDKHDRCLDQGTDLLTLIGLVVEAVLFGMFTTCMMCDQYEVVLTNVTQIDRLKGELLLQQQQQHPSDDRAGINEVFGTSKILEKATKAGFRMDWLLPWVKACFPDNVRNDIMGFCRPCVYGNVKEEEYESATMGKKEHGETGGPVKMNVSSGRRTMGGVAEIV